MQGTNRITGKIRKWGSNMNAGQSEPNLWKRILNRIWWGAAVPIAVLVAYWAWILCILGIRFGKRVYEWVIDNYLTNPW